MLKEGNVKRKSMSKRRSKSGDVVDGMSTKRDKRFSKNENQISVRDESATEVVLEVAKSSQFVIVESEENEVKRAVEAVVFGDENKDEVVLSNGVERRILGEVDGECLLYSDMCSIGGEHDVSNISGAEVGEKVALSSISSKVQCECVLCSAKVGKVMSVIC